MTSATVYGHDCSNQIEVTGVFDHQFTLTDNDIARSQDQTGVQKYGKSQYPRGVF